MTGRYLVPFCKNRLFVSATLISILCFLIQLTPFVSSADTLAKAKRLTHFYSVAPLLEKWFTCHHSTPYFFIILFPTAFYRRSRMTGKYLISFYKKLFYLSAHPCPFRQLRWHFPRQAGTAFFVWVISIFFGFTHKIKKHGTFFCSVLFCCSYFLLNIGSSSSITGIPLFRKASAKIPLPLIFRPVNVPS